MNSGILARSITRAASAQTYYTVKFMVDRPMIEDAYRAYAYFRWVDDFIDLHAVTEEDRIEIYAGKQAGKYLPVLSKVMIVFFIIFTG